MQSSLGQLREDVNEDDDIRHTHAKMDNDSVGFWDQILSFLINLKLLSDPDEAQKVKNCAKAFFLLENILWRRNGTKPPLQVILEPSQIL
jgi:hypothetical protein